MKTHWKTYAQVTLWTAVIMTAVIFWDGYQLNADQTHWSYILIKTITLGSFYVLAFLSYRTKKIEPWYEDIYLIIFHTYSCYGMVYIDMTYNFSFIEAFLIGAFLLKQTTRRFLVIGGYGLILTLIGFYFAKEPPFIAPGESYKPHSLIITLILYAVAIFIQFFVQRYQRKFVEMNERFALIGKQSSFLMHEIKNPLSRVVANSENEISAELMSDIKRDSQKISGLVSSIETLIHHPEKLHATFVNFNLNETRESILHDYNSYLSSMNIDHDFSKLDGLFYGNKHLIYQIIKNLIMNAIEAIGYRKDDRSLISIAALKSEGFIHLTVINTNSQISQKGLDQVFDPHFTTKKNGANKGLGLALVRSIVEAHGGKIIAKSTAQTVSFEMKLPDYSQEIVKA